jgi:small subunit ribosomal protein S7
MSHRLADELYAAAKGEGKAMTTRDQTHRMAEANKAFAHYAR